MTPDDIVAWLFTSEPDQSSARVTSDGKRKRQSVFCSLFPSPPVSAMDPDADTETRRKRIRSSKHSEIETDTNDSGDTYHTPRAKQRPPPSLSGKPSNTWGPLPGASTEHTSTTQDSSRGGQSRTSGRSSPRKRLRSLALQDDGVVTMTFEEPGADMPAKLRDFWRDMKPTSNGVALISKNRRQEIEAAKRSQDTASAFDELYPMHFPADDTQQQRRESLGPTPSVDDVLSVVEWAARCTKYRAEEAMWNSCVHFPLLQMAIYGGRRIWEHHPFTTNTTVELMQCITARIIPEYLPTKETYGKQIDFCLCLHVDEAAQQRIDLIRASLDTLCINHADLDALVDRPIAISIESKKLDTDSGAVQARLQVGMWHAAQWKLLKILLSLQRESVDNQNYTASLPAFLPAVIVSGHDWSFVATTQKEDKTLLWTEYLMGHTRDAIGIYKTIHGLQKLKAWALENYWPWYRRCVLGLTDDM